jgi:hypothetical protein
MGPGKSGQSENFGVFVIYNPNNIRWGLSESSVDYVVAAIPECSSNDLGPSVMSI